MEWAYDGVSWVLLRWHDLWENVFNGAQALATDWAWVLAIFGVVVTLRVILFPLFVKQIQSQRAMQKIAPEIKALQERYKGDKETLQKEMMELYRKEKANPLMGCLPILIQMPVFLALFHVLRRPDPDQTANHTLYGWTEGDWQSYIHAKLFDAPFWSSFGTGADQLELVGASPVTVKIVAGILVACMIVTTFLTTRQMILKTGWNEDPNQRMIQKVMLYGIPVIMIFSGTVFPIGVVIYWTVNNLFSLGQQQYVLRKYPPPVQTAATKPPKPGSKAHEKQLEAEREAEERRKSLAPKPGQKPKKQPSDSGPNPGGDSGDGASKAPKNNAPKGPGAGKNLSRAERIARAKKVSGAQQAGKKKKGKGGGSQAA